MKRPKPEEAWAASCIENALGGADIVIHDDGSQTRMHDLDIRYPSGSVGAVEVTGAGDAAAIEYWKLINGRWR